MYSLIKTTTRFAVVALGLLLTACVTDVYEPTQEKPKEPVKPEIPNVGFDHSTVENTTLSVNVNDLYNGAFDYQVEIYYVDPFDTKDAECMFKGITNMKKPLDLALVLPQVLTQIYVLQIDPTQGRSLQIIPVTTGVKSLSCDFRPTQAAGTKSTVSKLATKGDDSDYKTPANAIKIESGNADQLLTLEGKSYVIPASSTVKCNGLTLATGSKLYVEGTLDISGTTTSGDWGKTTMIVVQKEGKIIGDASVIGNKEQPIKIVVKNGASIKLPNATLLDCIIKNKGEIDVNKIEYIAGKKDNGISNSPSGIINVVDLDLIQSKLENSGKMTISGTLTANQGADIENECFMKMKNFISNNAKIELEKSSMFQCETLSSEGTKYEMEKYAILRATSAIFGYGNNKIDDDDDDRDDDDDDDDDEKKNFALVDFGTVRLNGDGGDVLTFSGNIHVKMTSVEGTSTYNLLNGAQKVDQIGSVEIPAGNCTGEGNVVEKPEPSNPNYPIDIPNGGKYTFAMEDNWPELGDYDMNDIVLGVEINLKKDSEEIIGMNLTMTLRAVGATKTLGAGVQFESVHSDKIKKVRGAEIGEFDHVYFTPDINGVESGTKAVLPLFDNAHHFLRGDKEQIPTNSYKYDKLIRTLTHEITFSSPIAQADLVITKLNFFIVIGGNAEQRTEVHLAGYPPTEKMKGDTKNYLSDNGMVWGIMIPTVFQYPREDSNIIAAYSDFEAWSRSGGTSAPDWYNRPNESNVLPIFEDENVGK